MSVYVVTWNLNKERKNYDATRRQFIAHLEKLRNFEDVDLESVRWIKTDRSASELKDYLRQKMDDDDGLFVCQLSGGDYAGWLNKQTVAWLEKHA